MNRLSAAAMMMAVMTLSACVDKAGTMLPRSGGRPYEVLVVTDDKACASLMDSVLTQDAAGLPQREPMFDVSTTGNSRFNAALKPARAIVMVNADENRFTSTRIRYEKNVWAAPQIIVYINTPSAETLRRDIKRMGATLTDLLARAETNAALSEIKKRGNPKAEKRIKEMFATDMNIPADMKSEKHGRHFIWLSDNVAGAMRNICVYSYTAGKLDAARFVEARDSIMKANIPGERDGMYMKTTDRSMSAVLKKERGDTVMVCRGLWEIQGDAMGGPFTAVAKADGRHGRIIVAEAFVYAPGTKKRNLIRLTEAALYSIIK